MFYWIFLFKKINIYFSFKKKFQYKINKNMYPRILKNTQEYPRINKNEQYIQVLLELSGHD